MEALTSLANIFLQWLSNATSAFLSWVIILIQTVGSLIYLLVVAFATICIGAYHWITRLLSYFAHAAIDAFSSFGALLKTAINLDDSTSDSLVNFSVCAAITMGVVSVLIAIRFVIMANQQKERERQIKLRRAEEGRRIAEAAAHQAQQEVAYFQGQQVEREQAQRAEDSQATVKFLREIASIVVSSILGGEGGG